MINLEIYCDESGIEALSDKNAHKYATIGGIWIPAAYRKEFKEKITEIKRNHNVHGELKWNKVSRKYQALYSCLIDYFFSTQHIRFRVILINAEKVNNDYFNGSSAELGFYKFYYQLIKHWIYDGYEYNVFLDYKVNGNLNRIKELKSFLERSNYNAKISQVQALPSHESIGVQFADVLTGAVAAKFNNVIVSDAKKEMIRKIEHCIGREIKPTRRNEVKFNVFDINLKEDW